MTGCQRETRLLLCHEPSGADWHLHRARQWIRTKGGHVAFQVALKHRNN